MIFMAFETGGEIARNAFELLYFPREHQKDSKVQFLSPKVQFFLLTIWKFQLFFVSLQCKKEYLKTPPPRSKIAPNSPVSGKPPSTRFGHSPSICPGHSHSIRLAHNPNPPRAHPHVGADHLPQPLREEGSKWPARTITNKMGKYGGQTQGSAPTRGACLCNIRSIAL